MNMTLTTRGAVAAVAATALVFSGTTGLASAQSGESSTGALSSDGIGTSSASGTGSSDAGSSETGSDEGGSSETGSDSSSDEGGSSETGSDSSSSIGGSLGAASSEMVWGSLERVPFGSVILAGVGVTAGIILAPQIRQALDGAGIALP